MPRREFLADLNTLKDNPIANGAVHDIQRGEEDGSITFLFIHPKLEHPVQILAGVTGMEHTASILLHNSSC